MQGISWKHFQRASLDRILSWARWCGGDRTRGAGPGGNRKTVLAQLAQMSRHGALLELQGEGRCLTHQCLRVLADGCLYSRETVIVNFLFLKAEVTFNEFTRRGGRKRKQPWIETDN